MLLLDLIGRGGLTQYRGENFRVAFNVGVDANEGNKSGVRYHRRIALPGDSEDMPLETREFVVASQIIPTFYHALSAIGLRPWVEYDHWRHKKNHNLVLHFDGSFEHGNSSAVIGLMRTVDDLVDRLTTDQH